MSRYKKVVNCIFYSIIILTIVLLYMIAFDMYYGSILRYIPYLDANIKNIATVMAIISITFSLLKFILYIMEKNSKYYFIIFENNGSVEISVNSIKNTTLNILSKYEEILESFVSVKIMSGRSDQNIILNIKCGIDNSLMRKNVNEAIEEIGEDISDENIFMPFFNVSEFCNKIQKNIHEELENFVGVGIEKVNIKIYGIDRANNKETNKRVN